MVFLMSWDKDKDFDTELPSNRENYSSGMFRWWGTDVYSRFWFFFSTWRSEVRRKWQSVKRSLSWWLSLHPKYVLADFFAFSGDSRNADCRQFLLFRFLPGVPADGTCRFVYSHRFLSALLIASEMLTASFFQRVKLGIPFFHFPKIWLPRTKQSCLAGETILFDASNYIVWLAKQYCSGHVLSISRKWNV